MMKILVILTWWTGDTHDKNGISNPVNANRKTDITHSWSVRGGGLPGRGVSLFEYIRTQGREF